MPDVSAADLSLFITLELPMFETRHCVLGINIKPFVPEFDTVPVEFHDLVEVHYTFQYSDCRPYYDDFLSIECWVSTPRSLTASYDLIMDTVFLFKVAYPAICFTTFNKDLRERLLREVSSLRHHAGRCSCGDE